MKHQEQQEEEEDEVISHRFLEYAVSGRGSCGACGKQITDGALRYGTKVHIRMPDGKEHDSLTWRCLACVSLRNFRAGHPLTTVHQR